MKKLLVTFATAMIAVQCIALSLTPSTAKWFIVGDGNNDLTAADIAAATGGTGLTLQYKSDVSGPKGVGADSGQYADSYNTAFSETLTDPKAALISYDTKPIGNAVIVGPVIYLIVKDGAFGNYWWNISGWNGTDSLDVSGVYPKGGAISSVSIYTAAGSASVPEAGSTAVILGASLLCIQALRRRWIRS